jgi:hypothetical protein
MGVSVGRLPQEVLLEEFYTHECSETVGVGRVRVFEELPTVFNCSVLTFGEQLKFHREYGTRVRYNIYMYLSCIQILLPRLIPYADEITWGHQCRENVGV